MREINPDLKAISVACMRMCQGVVSAKAESSDASSRALSIHNCKRIELTHAISLRRCLMQMLSASLCCSLL